MRAKRRRGQGEGSIYQRADGTWTASVSLGWDGGSRQRKVIYGKTRREAAEKLRAALNAKEQGALVRDERRTVADFLDWWLAEVVPNRTKAGTAASYDSNVRVHIVPALGRLRLTQLTPAHVQAMLNAKLAEGLSPRTVQYLHAILRSALAQALRWGFVTKNVAAVVTPPRVVREEVVPLRPEEARRLLDMAVGHRLEALYTVAVAVGLRQGEALALRWSDVDIEGGTLRVRSTVRRIRGEMVYSQPKSTRSRRTVSLPRTCVDALAAHRRRQSAERLRAGARWQDQGLVFPGELGGPLDAHTVTRHFHALCEKAGVGRRRFHYLRHTCASLLLAQGVHPRVVMEVLGHAHFAFTMTTYTHVMPSLRSEAADLMDGVLRPPAETPNPQVATKVATKGLGFDPPGMA